MHYVEGLENGVDFIINFLSKRFLERAHFLIGIDGGTGAGKTIFTEMLQQSLSKQSTTIISIDDYCIGKKKLYEIETFSGYPNWERPFTRDLGRLRSAITSLKDGKSVVTPTFSLLKGEPESTRLVSPSEVIIVEGIFALDSSLIHLYDLPVYIDASKSARFDRRIKREPMTDQTELMNYLESTASRMHAQYVEMNRESAMLIIRN